MINESITKALANMENGSSDGYTELKSLLSELSRKAVIMEQMSSYVDQMVLVTSNKIDYYNFGCHTAYKDIASLFKEMLKD